MHPLQWMGAVRMKVQTADKDITIIHTTTVQKLMWLWSIWAWSNGLTYGLEWCGLCDAVWTLILTAPIHCPLVSKWCNATFLQICSAEETSSSPSWVAWGWISFKVLLVNFHLKTSVLIWLNEFNTESKTCAHLSVISSWLVRASLPICQKNMIHEYSIPQTDGEHHKATHFRRADRKRLRRDADR